MLSGCTSTRKVARAVTDLFKKEESKKSDSIVTKTKDSTQVKQSSKIEFIVDTSGYVKETEENIIEWIIIDTLGNEVKKIVTNKLTKEKGHKKVTTTKEKQKSDSANVKQHESATVNKDSSGSIQQGRWEVNKEKNVKRTLPGMIWMIGGLVILAALAWFLRTKLYLIFPFLKPKQDDPER